MEMPIHIISADVIQVTDGDTIKVTAHPWPGMSIQTSVRIRGIDTPELRGKCQREKIRAKEARALTQSFVGTHVRLHNILPDKYGGRVVADVYVADQSLAHFLLDSGLARPYSGKKRESWCGS